MLADFDNKTGDPVFDDTVKQGLSVQLGSPFLDLGGLKSWVQSQRRESFKAYFEVMGRLWSSSDEAIARSRTLLFDIALAILQRLVHVSECLIDVFDRRLTKTAPLTTGID